MKKVLISFREETVALLDAVAGARRRSEWVESFVRRSLEAMTVDEPRKLVEPPSVEDVMAAAKKVIDGPRERFAIGRQKIIRTTHPGGRVDERVVSVVGYNSDGSEIWR